MTTKEIAFGAYFMGEGMLRVSLDWKKSGRQRTGSKYPWFRQLARITVRQDDEAILDWIKDNIGGHIFRRGVRFKIYNRKRGLYTFSNPVTIWQAENLQICKKVCKLVIQNPLPCKKKEEAKLFLKYIALKERYYVPGQKYPEHCMTKFHFYHEEMKRLKRFLKNEEDISASFPTSL